MSRSYRKVGAYTYCNGSSKKDRTLYHREERAKVRDLLKVQEKLGTDIGDLLYEEPCEKIVMNKVDRSLPLADKWSWSPGVSKRGRGDISSIRKDFDRALFGLSPRNMFSRKPNATLWDSYIENRNAKYNKKHPQLKVIVRYVVESEDTWSKLSKRLTGEPCYIRKFKSVLIPYNKAHKVPTYVYDVDGEIVNVSVHKEKRGIEPLSGKQYSISKYVILLAPNTFQKPEDLTKWLRKNQEKLVLGYFRRVFSK